MKYLKPELRLEKYTLAEAVMAEEEVSSIVPPAPKGPVIEGGDAYNEEVSNTSSAFSNVLDFSN